MNNFPYFELHEPELDDFELAEYLKHELENFNDDEISFIVEGN